MASRFHLLSAALLLLHSVAVSGFTGLPSPSCRLGASSPRLSSRLRMGFSKVFVAGGSSGVGKEVVRQLLADGAQVKALVRRQEAAEELKGMGAEVEVGDAMDYKTVEGCVDGCDAAITTLGGKTDDRRVDYEGNRNVIEAAGILGVVRTILVTSVGCGDSKEAAPAAVFETLKEVLAEKEKAENMLMKYYTNTDWTIIRPGGLTDNEATGGGILTEDRMAIGSVSRTDVASLVVAALNSKATIKKVLAAIDPAGTYDTSKAFDPLTL